MFRSLCPSPVCPPSPSGFALKRFFPGSAGRRAMVLAALLCLGAAAAHAATWTVDTLNDDSTTSALTARSNCAAGNSGTCALRDAILAAVSGDTINFSVTGTITLTNTLPTITVSLTITGPGANLLTVSGNNEYRVLFIDGTASTTVSISGLTIANGNSSGSGGIVFKGDTLTVTNCAFTGNQSSGTGAIGGAINLVEGTLTVQGTTFTNNSAGFLGGSVFVETTATITNSTFSGNSSQSGGAIYSTSTLTVTNSTFSGNSATSGDGGAIYAYAGGALTANNNLFSGNSSSSGGAGIYNSGGTVTASNNVYHNNLTNSSEDDCNGCTTGAPGSDGNVDATANPLLPLANYGGPTETMLPAPSTSSFTNPAICGGSDSLAAAGGLTGANALDQRGFPLVSSCVDAGADQSNYLQVQSNGDSGSGSSDCPGASCTLRDAIALADTNGYGDIDFASGVTTVNLTPANGDLTLSGSGGINIVGSGANQLTVSGGGSVYHVFAIDSGATALLDGLTVTGGNADGGGNDDTGGGIFNQGTLTVLASAISGNTTDDRGGGIGSVSGTLILEDSTVSANTASDSGGTFGGGIYNGATLTIAGSTVSGNTASSSGVVGNGGGIDTSGTLTITGSTVSGNTASGSGYGAVGGGIEVNFGTLTLANSIVAGNSVSCSGTCSPSYADISGSYTGATGAGNEASNNSSATSQIAIDLSPLQYNGIGATVKTMIPLPGSPAICAGLTSEIPSGTTTDERGYPNTNTTYTGYSSASPCVDSGAVQTNYTSAAFVQQPSNTAENVAMSPAPTVGVYETDTLLSAPNNTDAVGGVSVAVTPSGGTYAGSPFSATASSTSPFLASFSSLSSSSAASGIDLTTSPITVVGSDTLSSQTSNSYDVYGPATQLAVSAPATAVAGTNFLVTITAEDANGSTVLDFPPSDYVQPSSTDPQAGFAAVNLMNGTATVGATLKTAGNQTITATDLTTGPDDGITGTSGTIAVSAGTPTTLLASAGASQSTFVNLVFPTALQATVEDAYGNAVSGVTVNFAASGSGASATLSSPTCTTAANGICSITATANGTAGGPYRITATTSGAPPAAPSKTPTAAPLW